MLLLLRSFDMQKWQMTALVFSLTLGLAACGAATNAPSPLYPMASPSASSAAADALAQLVNQESLSPEEQRIRLNLAREVKLNFPLKVAVLFYNASQLNPSDQQKVFEGLKSTFKDSGMVRETIQIPPNLVSNLSMDFMRQLGSRFKADILLVVTGNHDFGRSPSQNLNFFELFGDKGFYESNIRLTGLAIDIFTGSYLNPLTAAALGGPKGLSPSDTNFKGESYTLKRESEMAAWTKLSKDFVEMLSEVKRESDLLPPRPLVTPVPSATPTPAPSATPMASASPAPN